MMMEVWCVYYVDSDASANAFRVSSPTPTVRDMMASFGQSRPYGERGEKFHWRLRMEDPIYGYCWQDVAEDHVAVAEALEPGLYAIFAKLTDVGPRAVANRVARGPRVPVAPADAVPERSVVEEETVGEDDDPPAPEESLLYPEDQSLPTPQESLIHEDSLFEPDGPASEEEVRAAVERRRETLARNISDNQREAREEMRRREEAKANEDLEFERLRSVLGPKLKAWCEEFGKKKNIRALLADMDKVMWPEANWQPISIADLIQPGTVKRAYYKASRFVHPDKLVGLTVEQRFIGQTIFDALSQAYADFEAAN